MLHLSFRSESYRHACWWKCSHACWRGSTAGHSGFSTVLALLLTGFVTVLASGILFLFLSENRINRSLYNGISAFHAAEGSMEYALLKIKHHREGFSDSLDFGDPDSKQFPQASAARFPTLSYAIEANATSHSGTIGKQGFEIIPLFHESGKTLSDQWKSPEKPIASDGFDFKKEVDSFTLHVGGFIVWNIIGNTPDGTTFGMAGTGANEDIGNDPSFIHEGKIRKYTSGVLSEETVSIADFLETYHENYLVLYNPGDDPVDYSISAPDRFSLPTTRITASGKTGDSVIHLELSENKSRLFDLLKYSLFVPR